MARREPVRRRRELDSYMQTLTGGNSADRVQVIVEPKIDDRPRNETGSPVRGGVAHSTGKRRGQRVGRHVDAEPSMTNDTKIVIELQAVETERALVVRGLFKRKSPNAPEMTGISRTLSVRQVIRPGQFFGFRVRRNRQTIAAALLSANPKPDPEQARNRIALPGEVPSLLARPSECEFHIRCPWAAADPGRLSLGLKPHRNRRVSCHFPIEARRGTA